MRKIPRRGISEKDIMDTISIRWGETLTLPLDTADEGAVKAAIFIGEAEKLISENDCNGVTVSEGAYVLLSQSIDLVDGKGVFEFSSAETKKEIGVYSYQINVEDAEGRIEKFPSAKCDDCELPKFIICGAIDEGFVS